MTKQTFDETFPSTEPLTHLLLIRDGLSFEIVKAVEAKPCWHCEMPTCWYDIEFGAYLCSPECEIAKWHEYAQAFGGGEDNALRNSL